MREVRTTSLLAIAILIASCAPSAPRPESTRERSISEITTTLYTTPPNQDRLLVAGTLVDLSPEGMAIKDARCGDFCRDIVGITYGASEEEQKKALPLVKALDNSKSRYLPVKIFVRPLYAKARQTLDGKTLYKVGELKLVEVSCTKC